MFGFGRIKELEKNYEKLNRIVKYSKDEPTFRISEHNIWPSDINVSHTFIIKNDLYIYIDKEEYCVTLTELVRRVNPRSCEFKVEDNFAYFTVNDYLYGIAEEFIIDYEKGTYVHRIISKEKEEAAECTDC